MPCFYSRRFLNKFYAGEGFSFDFAYCCIRCMIRIGLFLPPAFKVFQSPQSTDSTFSVKWGRAFLVPEQTKRPYILRSSKIILQSSPFSLPDNPLQYRP